MKIQSKWFETSDASVRLLMVESTKILVPDRQNDGKKCPACPKVLTFCKHIPKCSTFVHNRMEMLSTPLMVTLVCVEREPREAVFDLHYTNQVCFLTKAKLTSILKAMEKYSYQ